MISQDVPNAFPPSMAAGAENITGRHRAARRVKDGDADDRQPTVTDSIMLTGRGKKSSKTGSAAHSLAGKALQSEVSLSPLLAELVKAAERAPFIFTGTNRPENFSLESGKEVDPGSMASRGTDALGNAIWVVDQRVTYPEGPERADSALLDGFFCGGSAGKTMNGPRARIVAIERNGVWEEVPPENNNEKGALSSPFQDKSITRFIAQMHGVRPVPQAGDLLSPASFYAVVDTAEALRGERKSEFTLHFVNPEKRQGPFPGSADGAVHYRMTINRDKSVTMDGYYVIKAAKEYVAILSDFIPLGKTGKSFFSLGKSLINLTPVGLIATPLANALGSAAEKMTDSAIDSSGVMFHAASALHASLYRRVLFPNLLGK
jgi:hypothetical protein